jgi:hypothetical protein
LDPEGAYVLAEVQSALRPVALLVDRGAPPVRVFAAITEELAGLLSAEYAGLGQYHSDGALILVTGASGRGRPLPLAFGGGTGLS